MVQNIERHGYGTAIVFSFLIIDVTKVRFNRFESLPCHFAPSRPHCYFSALLVWWHIIHLPIVVKPQLNGRLLNLFLKGVIHHRKTFAHIFIQTIAYKRYHKTSKYLNMYKANMICCQRFNGKNTFTIEHPGYERSSIPTQLMGRFNLCHRRSIGPALPT